MDKTATFVCDLVGWNGRAKLYRVDPPHEGVEHVVVSAVSAPFSGPETYIFPADADGNVTSWLELDGSYRGGLNHVAALVNAGYVVVESAAAAEAVLP